MKKYFFLAIILYMLGGCHPRQAGASPASGTADTAAFLASFRALDFDTLSVACISDSLSDEHSFLHGVAIDSVWLGLFPDTVVHAYAGYFAEQRLFALGRFDLDERYQAYLYRWPVEGYADAIDLLVFDKKNRKFLNESLNLASDWGDAGEATMISSVLHKKNKSLRIDVAQNLQGADPSDTTFNTFVHTDIALVYRLDNGLISQLSRTVLKCDTITFGKNNASVGSQSTDSIISKQ